MTNEQAMHMLKAKLECLKRETSGFYGDCNNSNCDECSLCYEQGNMGEQKEALDMAIEALEQQPCEDTISRKALLEEIENGIKAGNYEEGYEEYPHINDMDDIIECIKYADSVQPKPKTDVLDKIRAEIAMYEADCRLQGGTDECEKCNSNVFGSIYRIIDKYKAESEDVVSERPTADVKPIVHAHWIKGIVADITCSNCDFPIYADDKTIHKLAYCPHCGAKMDECEVEKNDKRRSN